MDWAVVRVHDEGIGIPADEVSQVFDRFYRGRGVSASVEGTGLGLAAVRQIVELHGGSVAAESQPGAGTTFIVRLPVSDGSTDGQQGRTPARARRRKGTS